MPPFSFKLITKYQSPNMLVGRVAFLILHHTGASKAAGTVNWFLNPASQLSSHYLTDANGDVYQMVDEKNAAYQAGISYWAGVNMLNYSSIGIEQANADGNIHPYTEEQIVSAIELCKDIISRYNIPPRNIVGHADVAPNRKNDPGILFPWERLAQNGIGAYPKQSDIAMYEKRLKSDLGFLLKPKFIDAALITYGYDPNPAILYSERATAFNRHFCQSAKQDLDITGMAKLCSLIAEYISLEKLNAFIESCRKS